MPRNESINYLEIPSSDLTLTKAFFSAVFNWKFTDYGPEYCAFESSEIEGGFFYSEKSSQQQGGSVLIVFYSDELLLTQEKVVSSGGTLFKEIFEFPGGRRFHFFDPTGNEFAVWSDK
ncbi:VOC family protein [Pleionea litopenaei]|uniref:VOC family protein n=1 Tax=Pleionea litopenaei TaxID=3070815 RepID=A0AA51X7Q5_9GAMM|nr:VOC family protein [Pleionea sp. HL-JVS1]WMS87355.1 VOC family protein [Pleionea sp. HL-JVS1]